MTSCSQIMVTVAEQTLAAQIADMNYKKARSNAWRALTKAIQTRDAKYPGGSDGIDAQYASGWYVPAGSTFVEINGTPYDCESNQPYNGLPPFCTTVSDERATKCCACNLKYTGCNATWGCNNNCSNGRLSQNRFQSLIDAAKSDLANMNVQINALQTAYNTVPAASPPFPNFNVGCCQSIIIQGISATAVNFDPNAVGQQCTIVNGAQNTATSAPVQKALRVQGALRAQNFTSAQNRPQQRAIYNDIPGGHDGISAPVTLTSNSCSFNPATSSGSLTSPNPVAMSALSNSSSESSGLLKTILGVFGR